MVRFEYNEVDPRCYKCGCYVAICDSNMGTIFNAHHRLGTLEQREGKNVGADQPGKGRDFEGADLDPSLTGAMIAAVPPAPPQSEPAF